MKIVNLHFAFCIFQFAIAMLLAGCVPSPVSRSTNPQTTYAPASSYGSQAGSAPAGYPAASNGPSTTAGTTQWSARYVDPNAVSAGAGAGYPPGPQSVGDMPPGSGPGPASGPATGPMAGPGPMPGPNVSPYDMPSGGAGYPLGPERVGGPPPGYTRPAPAGPTVVAPEGGKKSDEDNEWDISHLAPDYTWKKMKEALGWGPDERLAKIAYDNGQALYNAASRAKTPEERQKNFEAAAKEFYTATWRWPDSTMEEDAMFLMAESYFLSDHYGKAQDSYTNLLKEHANTRYLDTVMARLFAVGTYWEQLDLQYHHWPLTPNVTDKTQPLFDTIGNALACYSLVWTNDPTGPLADSALFRVANAHFRRGEWEDAAQHYDMLRRNHPKSKYQKDAHLLELQAKLRLYQGPLYSVNPLKDAKEIGEQTLKQFPGQLGPDEQRVRQTLAMMVEQFAEREWVVAQYYDRKADYRAAREYYQVILDKYSKTSFAPRAAQRMAETKGLPDEPPNHFQWLTDAFGKGK